MIIREAYRNRTHRICRRHYRDSDSLPYAAGPIQDSRHPHSDCEQCEIEARARAETHTTEGRDVQER